MIFGKLQVSVYCNSEDSDLQAVIGGVFVTQ